jgi:hypothetical protein
MRFLWLLVLFVAVAGWRLSSISQVAAVSGYAPMPPAQIELEIDEFIGQRNAIGYLLWQYSGYAPGAGQHFENDKYSFFRSGTQVDNEICATLKKMGAKYNDRPVGVGVNIWSLGKQPAGVIGDHLNYLKTECGVKTVRVFIREGGIDGFKNVLQAGQDTGVQIIGAIGDYSNGGGGIPKGADGAWYSSGYTRVFDGLVYRDFARDAAAAASGYSSLYGLELANEPHCGSDTTAIPAYNSWVSTMADLLKPSVANVGIGQMASQTGSVCDNAGSNFVQSNSAGNITMASGHYYNQFEKEQVIAALGQSPKPFYIGEASWGGVLNNFNYYILPVPGLNEDLTANVPPGQLAHELIDQGYQVQCTTPTIQLAAQLAGPIEQAPQGHTFFMEPSIQQDLSKATTPLFRSPGSNTLLSSIESFFGYVDTDEAVDSERRRIGSAPIYRLLGEKERCERQLTTLATIERLCNQLKDPTQCALDGLIVGTELKATELLGKVRSEGFTCEDDRDAEDETYQAVSNVPLSIESLYRYAFLVIAAEHVDTSPTAGFRFLSADTKSGIPKHDVKVIAFKYPAVGTNGYLDANNPLYYNDSMLQTRNFLQTPQQRAIEVANEQGRREQFKSGISASETDFSPLRSSGLNIPIDCGDRCGDQASQALVAMINQNGSTCITSPEDLEYEPSTEINAAAGFAPNDKTEYRQFNEWGDQVAGLIKQQITDSALMKFLAEIRITSEPSESNAKIVTYLVYPVGAELESVETTLSSLVLTPEQQARLQSDPTVVKYFALKDATVKYDDGGKPFLDFMNTPKDSSDDVAAEVKMLGSEADYQPRILGGVLGKLIRIIERNLSPIGSAPYNYISSCKTLEEFLLNQCDGAAPAAPNAPGDQPQVCQQKYDVDVEVTGNMSEVAKTVKRVADEYGLDAELMWGILNIEGSPFLRTVRAGGGTKNCLDWVNSCGAVGPLQMIDGICTTDACGSAATEELKTYTKDNLTGEQLCNLDTALDVVAQKLKNDLTVDHVASGGSDQLYRLAGRYHGLPIALLGPKCAGAPPVQGCNGMNYCECAVDGFDDTFNELLNQ